MWCDDEIQWTATSQAVVVVGEKMKIRTRETEKNEGIANVFLIDLNSCDEN